MSRGGVSAGVAESPPMVTQFAVPSLPFGMIERPRLSGWLRAGLNEPVTLVCAPAGSGKTALVAAEVRGGAYEHVAWVTLEPAQDDPRRLWDVVLTALDRTGAVPADSALAAHEPSIDEHTDRRGRHAAKSRTTCATRSTTEVARTDDVGRFKPDAATRSVTGSSSPRRLDSAAYGGRV